MPTFRDNVHWLPVDKRIEFKLCLLVFKCKHQMAPPYLASMCVQLSAYTRSHQLRSAARNWSSDPTYLDCQLRSTALPCLATRAAIICRRNWSLLHWHCSSSVTDSKLYCFPIAMHERCRHDFVIASHRHKLILYWFLLSLKLWKLAFSTFCCRVIALAFRTLMQ